MPRIPSWLFNAVTLTVVGLWATGIVLTFTVAGFKMPESLNGLMPTVLLGLYGARAISESRNDRGDRNNRRPGGDDDDEH